MISRKTILLMAASVLMAGTASAQETVEVDSGATAWMLTSTALVLLMIPGLAMFYGGLVRTKNVLIFPTGRNVSDNVEAVPFSCHVEPLASHFPNRAKPTPFAHQRCGKQNVRWRPLMSSAIRQASHAIVAAALLYKEFAISASELLRPGSYFNLNLNR